MLGYQVFDILRSKIWNDGRGNVDVHVGAEAELVEAHAGVVAVVVGVEDTLLIVVVEEAGT